MDEAGVPLEAALDGSGSGMPSYDALRRPMLEALCDGEPRDIADLVRIVADDLQLDSAAREARIPSGEGTLQHRLGWARTSLAKAGLLEQPKPSTVAITEAGRRILAAVPGPLTHALLLERCPGYANWVEDMGGQLRTEQRAQTGEPTAWMMRAGRGGAYAPLFVERRRITIDWGETGSVNGLSRDAIGQLVATQFVELHRNHRGQIANMLYHLANTMANGDLIVTPEPASRTIVLGWVTGAYEYLDEPTPDGQRHARPVRWFARISRDDLSYGAQNSLGSLLTLTRPGHEVELLRIAEAHASDPDPAPLVQRLRGQKIPVSAPSRVTIPVNAGVPEGAGVSEFHTNPRRLMQLLDDLHSGELALPDFQRSFVWAPDATRELLVSMVRSFPAGALLFLQGGANAFKPRAAEEAPELSGQPSYLVLDGQQRLTSLYQAVFGVGQSRFFLDIGALISGGDANDAIRVLTAERAAAFATTQAQADSLMMPLPAVRGSGAARWRDEVVDLRDDENHATVRGLLRDVEAAYIDPLVQYAFPVTVLPATTELEAVCTIFETLNRTGKPLTPFELISARAFAGGHSLRDFWEAAREEFPVLADFDVEPYYILQVVALRLGATCKRSAVLAIPSEAVAREWADAVADTAAAIAMLRDECGVLVSKWLPYQPMLIPLAAAWRQIAIAGGPIQAEMRSKLKRWFWRTCFTGEYESSSASLAERDTPVLKAWLAGGDEPPVVRDFVWDPERWRTVTIRQQGLYRSTMALMLTRQPRDLHTGAPLTRETIETGKIDDHHVFPRAYLAEHGYAEAVDSVLNHCLIDRATNIRIGKNAPSTYLAEVRAALGSELERTLASHRLPTGPQSPLLDDDFDAFLSWRIDELTEALAEEAGVALPLVDDLDPQRARLDARIEAVELRLRRIVAQGLNGDKTLLPPHITQRILERRTSAARRLPGSAGDTSLAKDLEYSDLRDLQEILTSRMVWSYFETSFGTKEALNARFGQLAELRNPLRHSRPLSPVAVKDGEAAILWFAGALDAGAQSETT